MDDDRPSAGPGHWVVLFGVAGAVLLADQIAKATVRARLPYGDTTRLGGVLELHHPRNDGLLGGTCPARRCRSASSPSPCSGRARLLRPRMRPSRRGGSRRAAAGGRVGNMLDRLRLGYVTDWIARNDRNAFNLADLAIYIGLGLVLLLLLVADRRDARRRPARL